MVAVAKRPLFEKIVTIGSSSENRFLTQIKADVYGFPIHVNPVREAISLGAALLAGIGSRTFKSPSACDAGCAPRGDYGGTESGALQPVRGAVRNLPVSLRTT